MTCRPIIRLAAATALLAAFQSAAAVRGAGERVDLNDGWRVRSSVLVHEPGAEISAPGFMPRDWMPARLPATPLKTLVEQGVYPDPRLGLNTFKIPDSSDEFNRKHDLAKYSYLPDQRNPWRDPYWYRTEFNLPGIAPGRRVWLEIKSLNYRGEVWVNGVMIAGHEPTVGMFQRFRLDMTAQARAGRNAIAVKVFPVDHPGEPETQLDACGKDRGFHKEIMKDVTEVMTIGYDCLGTVPDRNMGIVDEVFVEQTGPIDIRHPFITTDLPLPATDQATLGISAELVNAGGQAVRGTLRGEVADTEVRFEVPVEIPAGETKTVAVNPSPVLHNPRLWWPANYGEQPLYQLRLTLDLAGTVSDVETVSFGVREVEGALHERDGAHGRRITVNGQKIFAHGGYIQPEFLLDWDARRIETEIRYYREANLNLIYFEDIPNPPESLLDACDRMGILFGNCFYACAWPQPGTDNPNDLPLLERCTVDLFKRYRNHPSLVMYMVQNEADTRQDVYEMWRRLNRELDGTRFWIPSGYYPDDRKDAPAWTSRDLPAGMTDLGAKTYSWVEPATYFDWVKNERSWMFKIENGSASVPPISSLSRFLPDLGERSPGTPFPLTAAWAHHDACHYFKDYDSALRRLFGEPENVTDYCWKAQLLTADQHRAMHESVNHRMWDITSGLTQWKINAAWPSVEWQIFDWYFRPMSSYFVIRRACQPLHVQLSLPDLKVSVINRRLQAQPDLKVTARVFDLQSQLRWKKTVKTDVDANTYREVLDVAVPPELTSGVYFVRLDLEDKSGRAIADNFYWLRAGKVEDYKSLESLPMVGLETELAIQEEAEDLVATVKVHNPSDRIAFLTQLALTTEQGGEELLPVYWSDNHFSLLPKESRTLTARIPRWAAVGRKPKLEIGGWNVASEFRCDALQSSRTAVVRGEPLDVRATIGRTFLDGSRIPLQVDGKPVAVKWCWARTRPDMARFTISLDEPGRHILEVGGRSLGFEVR